MSEIGRLTKQLDDDVSKADVFVNGDEKAEYSALDGAKVPSIRKFLSGMANGVKGYQTLKDLNKVTGAFEGQLSQVMNDGKASGYYLWDGSKWIKSDLDYVDWAEVGRVDGELDTVRRQYVKKSDTLIDGVMVTITDELGNRTWLEANDNNGGITGHAKNLIEKGLGVQFANIPSAGLSMALVDASGVAYDLSFNDFGEFSDLAIRGLRRRLSCAVSRMGVFGSSTFEYMHASFLENFKGTNAENIFLGGDSGAVIESIAARLGASNPAISFPDGEISPHGTAVNANWRIDSKMKAFNVVLDNGVRGVVSYQPEHGGYEFIAPEESENIPTGDFLFSVIPDSVGYLEDLVLINAGKNNLTSSDVEINGSLHVFDYTEKMVDFVKSKGGFFLVVGNFINTNQSAFASAPRILDCNAMLKNRFGKYYFDAMSYICSDQIWIDIGKQPTDDDLEKQAKGELAVGLSRDAAHLSVPATNAVCAKIKEKLILLNYITEY